LISYDEALDIMLAAVRPMGAETVRLRDAAGRVAAAAVRSQIASPRTDVSTMDGYAVRGADLARLPARLRVAGEALPGQAEGPALQPGTCVRIFTGAAVPEGADRVVIQEEVRREGDEALIDKAPGAARYIRPAGADFSEGEELLPAGTLLGPRAMVAAAAADVARIDVHRRPRVRLFATGDELAEPGSARDSARGIPDSVSFGVAALAAQWSADVAGITLVGDDLPAMRAAAASLADVDLLVVTGGASVGERDFAKAMFSDALELLFSKMAMKPGKPVWLGRVGTLLVLGLPGNPTSAMVTARLFLAPLLAAMSGRDPASALAWRRAPLAEALEGAGGRETFSRGYFEDECVRLLPNQDSGAQKMLVRADLLVRRPAGEAGFAAGDKVRVLDF
jgi:molybdopterin molybdotransferase